MALMPHLNAQVQKNVSSNNTAADINGHLFFFCLLLKNEYVFILYTENCVQYVGDQKDWQTRICVHSPC